MQTQTMSKAPPSQSSILPPLQNLPSWSRSSLERTKQPRPIVRDPPPNTSFEDNGEEFEMTNDQSTLNPPSNGLRTVSAPLKSEAEIDRRVVQIEKSLEFVQSEHAQVLENLHKEIERLKLENKELNFKLIMSRSGVSLDEEQDPMFSKEIIRNRTSPVQEPTEKKIQNEETEAKQRKQMESENTKKESTKANENRNNTRNSATSNLKKRTTSGKKGASSTPPTSGKKAVTQQTSSKSSFLSKARAKQIHKEREETPPPNTPNQSRTEPVRRTPQSPLWSAVHGGQKMLIVTLNKDKTMQVHVPTENGPRSPTLSECKTIIVEQQETNHKQAKELLKLRADLREAITSQKWNQNTYLVGRSVRKIEANSSSSSAGQSQVNRYLPKLPLREPISGRFQGRGPAAPEKISLPALRPNINSVVADRRRRQQAILRGRMGRKDFI